MSSKITEFPGRAREPGKTRLPTSPESEDWEDIRYVSSFGGWLFGSGSSPQLADDPLAEFD